MLCRTGNLRIFFSLATTRDFLFQFLFTGIDMTVGGATLLAYFFFYGYECPFFFLANA